MADPVTLSAGIGWGVTAAGWLISPIVSRLVNKCFDALGLDPRFQSRKTALTKKLDDLQTRLLPQLIILTDAAQRSLHRRELEAWLQKLKSAYYEAEHLLGLVEYTQLEKKANSSFPTKSTFNFRFNPWDIKLRKYSLLKSLENLEKIIVDETSEFAPILNLSTNTINNSIPGSNEQKNEQSSETISTYDFEVIGRDKDRDNIVQLLLRDFPHHTKCYSVIGLWGMGGSGKTTLAQYVKRYVEDKYLNINDVKVDGNFDLVAWVHVSQNFNVKSILAGIWESAFKEPCPNFQTIEGLGSKLQEKLKGKRFFLVLDDAWCDKGVKEPQFQKLFAPLKDAKRGSKILVTTRIEEAAKALGATELIPLRQLDHDQFIDLFMSQALCDLEDSKKHLEENLKQIGEQIVAKLSGSPLAATTVANMLRRRQDPGFWQSMLERNLLNETMGALLLSYHHLPPPLQRCFAFCSLFPKGHKFDQDHLVGLWIGEGFIEPDGSNRHVREIGNEYILELLASSFFQHKEDKWGYKLYTIHDLLHDLAENVSKGECFRIEDHEKRDIPIQTRHLYVDPYMFEEYLRKIGKLKDLRTIIFGSTWRSLKAKDLNALFKRSKKLYVVDIDYYSIDGWPEYLLTLKNLRYLNYGYIKGIKFENPSTGLYQLRLLQLQRNKGFSNIEISNVGRLSLLQDLPEFYVGNERGRKVNQLEPLQDLYGKLDLYGLANVHNSQEAYRVKLSEKKGLRELNLWWGSSYMNDDHCTKIEDAEVILDALCPPPQLERLGIHNYNGKRCPIWLSEYNKNTTHLKELKLFDCKFLEALPETNNLIHLQSLVIRRLPGLKTWASLPSNLVNLRLFNCASLAFLSEEDKKIRMSIQSGEPSQIDKELEKRVSRELYDRYLRRQKELDRICQLKEVNGELCLPITLEKLKMEQCFISDQILASSLKGHTSLTHLELQGIIPITCVPREVLSSLTNLQYLAIRRCWMLTSVDGLSTLRSLEELSISYCPYLTIESLDLSNSKSLSSLSLRMCRNLVSLMGLNELNNLEILTVVGCDKLQCPSDANKSPGVRWYLKISKLSMLKLVTGKGLSSLRCLTIQKAEQEYFTREECEVLSYLSSLTEIKFAGCKIQFLPDLSCLKSLTTLEITWCKDLKSLPDLSCLKSLERLEIFSCEDLISLPELPPSVQSISIFSCEDLISLPELPPSVQSISIGSCSTKFTRSCEDRNHPNCQKISHIPKKHIY